MAKAIEFRRALESVYRRYNRREFVHPDPLEFLYRYPAAQDREIAGLVASSLAYGNVKQILKAAGAALDVLGPSPRRYLETAGEKKINADFRAFKYRFTQGCQLAALLLSAREIIKEYGGLGECASQAGRAPAQTAPQAQRFLAGELRRLAPAPVSTLIPAAEGASALKRMNLYFRWMCRRDAVDPGGWKLSPAALVVPLDTHMGKIARELRLTKRADAGMKTALEITAGFAAVSPEDPVKYDFCLTRFGIRDELDLPELRKCFARAA